MRLAFALAGVLLLAAAHPAAAKEKKDPAVARGQDVARRTCAACHALKPGGESAVQRAPPFASREMQHTAGLQGRLAQLTREGHYGMPPQPLSEQEVRDLLAFIESLGDGR